MKPSHPAWIEVSLGSFRRNVKALKSLADPARLLPVIKADAYGHGAARLSQILRQEGIDTVAVAIAQEGADLRVAGWKGGILVLEPTLPEYFPVLFKHRLTPQVSSLEGARFLDRAVGKAGWRAYPFHVKIDSGMGRTGFRPDELVEALPQFARLSRARVGAFYTHLATADWKEGAYAEHQIALFHHLREEASAYFPSAPWHMANSAALLGAIPLTKGDWVRPGLALYGLPPNEALSRKAKLESVMTFKARVLMVKTVGAGESVGYNRTFIAKAPTRLAVLSAGYADGIHRSLSNRGHVLIHGRKVPMVGTVCMDMTMADVTKVPGVKAGDAAVFFGRDGKASLSAEEQAAAAGTISYELLCAPSRRVERLFVP